MPRHSAAEPVPNAVRIQLARLFGSSSKETRLDARTPIQWKRTLKKLLEELDQYRQENTNSDALHQLMLMSGLWVASESLKEEVLWPGYVEGIARFALVLMGDYPDHRKRESGPKGDGYYQLSRLRSLC